MAVDMAMIWAERLVANTQTWDRMPRRYQDAVGKILRDWLADNTITQEQYDAIMNGGE